LTQEEIVQRKYMFKKKLQTIDVDVDEVKLRNKFKQYHHQGKVESDSDAHGGDHIAKIHPGSHVSPWGFDYNYETDTDDEGKYLTP